MKTFLSLSIAGLIFLISTGLYAQSENRLEAGGYRLEEIESQIKDNRKSALPSENQIGQGAEPTANCNNALPCYQMMNPAMVEESEEAIEKFIIGKARPALPVTESNCSENEEREQVAAIQELAASTVSQSLRSYRGTSSFANPSQQRTIASSIPVSRFNRQEEEFSSLADVNPAEETFSFSNNSAEAEQPSRENSSIFSKLTGYCARAVELARTTADSLYLCPPEAANDCAASKLDDSQQLELKDEATEEIELPSQELKNSTKISTATDHLHRSQSSYFTPAAKAAVAYFACSSMVPQAFAARESAFAAYSGLSTDSINPISINANADGSYNMGGYLYTSIPTAGSPINGLLGKLRANGQKEWFNEQASSLPGQGIISASTVVMDGALYSGGQVYSNGWYPYISKSSPAAGTPLSAWALFDHAGYITNIFPTASNALTCFGFNGFQNFVLEFDPDQGVVTSASTITSPGDGPITEAITMSDQSYLIGGYNLLSPNQGWLSKISSNGADWTEHWTQVYSNSVSAFIMSIAEKNNTVIFSGAVNNDGFIGSVNGITGQSN